MKKLIVLLFLLLCLLCACSPARSVPAPAEAQSEDEAEVIPPTPELDKGPALFINGESAETCRLLDGVAVCGAAVFADRVCESFAQREEDGAAVLTLTASDHTLTLREGADCAVLDGETIPLPVPVTAESGTLYLPVCAAFEALGCTLVSENASEIRILHAQEGGTCFFGGRALEETLSIDGNLYAPVPALSKALGLELTIDEGALILDGKALSVPLLSDGKAWLCALSPLAAALSLEEKANESGAPVYSRITPSETAVWIDGVQTDAFTSPDGGLFAVLGEAADALGGAFSADGNDAVFSAYGREIRLTGGSCFVLSDGEPVRLSAPVQAEGKTWYAPAELLLRLGLSELDDPEANARYYTRIVRASMIPEGVRVPVLMYHAVSDAIWGVPELFVSPSRLESQLQAMQEKGFTAVTFEDLDRIDEIENPVMLTFDDGYEDNYTELFPLLQKYNMKATIFMIADAVGSNRYLTREQIREMSDSGLVSIQSHTLTHAYLNTLSEDELIREHRDSMLALARITGKQPFALCYPAGRSSASSREITAQYYEFGLNMSGPCYKTGGDPYRIWRYYISRDTDLYTFLYRIEGKG
ncbi:MAG: polysaccharide deacetylase family protein [Oscillospiraceae bacterium]|nr:polysaccharide deacetylase family protein [Oscillospiraceae bacterium]